MSALVNAIQNQAIPGDKAATPTNSGSFGAGSAGQLWNTLSPQAQKMMGLAGADGVHQNYYTLQSKGPGDQSFQIDNSARPSDWTYSNPSWNPSPASAPGAAAPASGAAPAPTNSWGQAPTQQGSVGPWMAPSSMLSTPQSYTPGQQDTLARASQNAQGLQTQVANQSSTPIGSGTVFNVPPSAQQFLAKIQSDQAAAQAAQQASQPSGGATPPPAAPSAPAPAYKAVPATPGNSQQSALVQAMLDQNNQFTQQMQAQMGQGNQQAADAYSQLAQMLNGSTNPYSGQTASAYYSQG